MLVLLNEQLGPGITALETLRPGAWSAAFGFVLDQHPYVIRFSEHADDFDRDAFARRFASPTLPVPAVTRRGTWKDLNYAVSERVPGACIDILSPDDFQRTLPSLLDVLDALRRADVSGSTGYGTWGPDGNGMCRSWKESLSRALSDTPEQRGGSWRVKLETSPTGATAYDRERELLLRRLDDMPNLRHIVHCDLLNFNVLVEDHRISGVIDWGCAMYGDFLYELAWFAFWWPWYPQWAGINVVDAAITMYVNLGADLTGAHERLLCYQLHIGLTHQSYNASIEDWAALEAVTRHTTTIANEIR